MIAGLIETGFGKKTAPRSLQDDLAPGWRHSYEAHFA
jgi:hypothetical protein